MEIREFCTIFDLKTRRLGPFSRGLAERRAKNPPFFESIFSHRAKTAPKSYIYSLYIGVTSRFGVERSTLGLESACHTGSTNTRASVGLIPSGNGLRGGLERWVFDLLRPTGVYACGDMLPITRLTIADWNPAARTG